jgi:hypothetical protein
MRLSIIVTVLLIQLFVYTNQAPAVRCGTANVLEEEFDLESPKENCNDKFVCELDCTIWKRFNACKYNTFLDLTQLLQKDESYKTAYNKACKTGVVSGEYLSDPISLKFRHLVGLITHITQKSFYHTYLKNQISFKKYPALYKTPFKKIKKLEVFRNKKFIKALVLFESKYVMNALKQQSKNHKNVIWGLYNFMKGLMGAKKLCRKHFEEMKDKSEGAVASMIVNEIHKQMKEAFLESIKSKGEVCDAFCMVYLRYFRFKNNKKWSSYFVTMKNVILDLYAHNLAKKMIKKKENSEMNYCACRKIISLNKFIKSGMPISKYFDEGFNLDNFQRFVFNVCKSKCEPQEDEDED